MSAILQAARVSSVDLWVLDVEGAELLVLQGMDFGSIPVRLILVERSHDPSTESAVSAHLRAADFELVSDFVSTKKLNALWRSRTHGLPRQPPKLH